MSKRRRALALATAAIVAIVVAILALRGCQPGDLANGPATQAGAQARHASADGMATITIDNGAAQANTSSAVNGLHVYNPDVAANPELDDYVSGAEAELGTPVSIYVYNLASPVHLTVEHNGEVIVDKDYAQLKATDEGTIDESGVEFIDVVLEGDLVVRTTALDANTERPAGTSLVNISDTTLGSVYVGSERIPDGGFIKNGTYDFAVTATQDMYAELKVNGTRVGYERISGGATHTFASVAATDATLDFVFTEAAVAEATQSSYPVYINDLVGRSDVELDVRWVDFSSGTAQQRDVYSGTSYPTGLELYSRVVNRSNLTLRLTATVGGRTVGSVVINPKPTWDEATYFGIDSFRISGTVTFTLSIEGQGTTQQASDPTPGPVTPTPGGQGGQGEQVRYATITINDGAAAANTSEFVNGLHVYNPNQRENPSLANYRSGARAPLGSRVSIYPYPTASAIQLRVVHNGRVLYDGAVRRIQANVDDAYVNGLIPDFTLEGDLVVTTSLGALDPVRESRVFIDGEDLGSVSLNGTTYANASTIVNGSYAFTVTAGPAPVTLTVSKAGSTVATADLAAGESKSVTVPVDADVTFAFERVVAPAATQHLLTLDNQAGAGVSVNATTVDFSGALPKSEPLAFGQEHDEGTAVFLQVQNASADPVLVSAVVDGTTVATATVAAGDFGGITGTTAGSYDGIALTGPMTVLVEKVGGTTPDPEPGEKTFRLRVTAEDGLRGYDVMSEATYDTINDGDELSGSLEAMVSMPSNEIAKVTITMGDQTIKEYVAPNTGAVTSFAIDEVTDDVCVSFTRVAAPGPNPGSGSDPEPEGRYTLTLNDGASAATNIAAGVVNALHVYDANSGSDWPEDLASGTALAEGTRLCAYVWNTATPVRLTVTVGGQTVIDRVFDTDKGGQDLDSTTFEVTGDVVVTTSVADASEVEPTPAAYHRLTITADGVDAGNVYLEPLYDQLEDGAPLEAGTTADLYIDAPRTSDVHVTVYVGGRATHSFDLAAGRDKSVSVEVTGDVAVTFAAKPAEPTQYTVDVQNPLAESGVTVRLSSVDSSSGVATQVPLAAGGSYAAGTGVFVQVINDSDSAVRVTATVGGSVLESTTVSAGGAGGLMGTSFEGLLLSGNMLVSVEDASGPVTPDPADDPDPSEGEKDEFTATFVDGAAEGSSSEATNRTWFYNESVAGWPDLKTGDTIRRGDKVCAYVMNYSTPVHLTIKNGDEVVVDRDFNQLQSMNAEEEFEFLVKGDVSVVSSVITGGTSEPEPAVAEHPVTIQNETGYVYIGSDLIMDGHMLKEGSHDFEFYGGFEDALLTVTVGDTVVVDHEALAASVGVVYKTIEVTGPMTITYEPVPATHKITVEDLVGAGDAFGIFSVDFSGGVPRQVVLRSGESYEEGTGVFARLQNTGSSAVRITVLVDGQKAYSTEVAAGDFGGIMASDEHPNGLTLNGEMTIRLELAS